MRIREDERRSGARWIARVEAQLDYLPWDTTGRWWENLEVRAADVGEGGLRLASPSPLRTGGRVRLVVPPRTLADSPLAIEGEIVWVREPWLPVFGMYQAGVMFKPALQKGVDELMRRAGAERMAEPAG